MPKGLFALLGDALSKPDDHDENEMMSYLFFTDKTHFPHLLYKPLA